MPKSFIFYQMTRHIAYALNVCRMLVRIQDHSKVAVSDSWISHPCHVSYHYYTRFPTTDYDVALGDFLYPCTYLLPLCLLACRAASRFGVEHRDNNPVAQKGSCWGNSSKLNYPWTSLILISVVLAKQTRQGDDITDHNNQPSLFNTSL